MHQFRPLALDGAIEVTPNRHADERGFFSEVYNTEIWKKNGVAVDFVQDNHSMSVAAGVLRGLHFQTPPFAQAKLVRASRGSIFDVAVDIRRNSPGFKRWIGLILSAEKGNQLFLPVGFAHGFLTLEPNTEVQYKVSADYSPEHDRTIRFNDPEIGIVWPNVTDRFILSDKDRQAPCLAEVHTGF
jgi:dTDP-4-dehydrorhamnose 3,5-epimerase